MRPLLSQSQQLGVQVGNNIAQGVQSAEGKVRQASQRMTAARDAEADAVGRARVAEAELNDLRARGVTSGAQLVRAEESLAAALRDSTQAANRRASAVDELSRAQADLANSSNDAEDSADDLGGSVDSLGGSLDSGLGKIGAFTAGLAGIGGAVALGMQAIDNMNVESKLAAQLGATGELAAQYGDQAGALFESGIVGSMDEAAVAIGAVASSFQTAGFEGEKSVDQIAASAQTFANVFGTDVTEAVNTASLLVTNGLAADSTEAFDLMTASFQRVPAAMRDELPEILQEYSTNFRSLGFDGQESFGLLVSAAEQGKFALDKTGDALKEFSIRGSDMSKTSVDAFQAIGLNAEQMSAQIAAGGDGAQAALQATAQGILGIEDPAERANTAIALFGTPLEDLSVDQIPAFLQGLTGAGDEMAGFEGSAQQMADTMNSGPGPALEKFKNTITGGLTDALGTAAQFLMQNSDTLKTVGAVILPVVAGLTTYAAVTKTVAIAQTAWTAVTQAGTVAQWALNAAMSANPIGLIIAGVVALGAALVLAWNKSETFRNVVIGAWEGIKSAASAAWNNFLKPAVDGIVAGFQWVGDKAMWLWNNAIAPAWEGITNVISTYWNGFVKPMFENFQIALGLVGDAAMWLWNNAISPAFNGIGSVISTVWTATISPVVDFFKAGFQGIGDIASWLWNNAIVPAFDGIKSAISAAWDFLKPIFDFIGKGIDGIGSIASSVAGGIKAAFSGVVDVLKAPVRYIGQLLQKIPEKIGPFTVPGASSLRSWGQSLQALRSGGIVRGPGTGTSDSILGIGANGAPTALVSAGEFVVNAKSTAENLPLLRALNAGWTPSAEFVRALVMDGDFKATGAPRGISDDNELIGAFLDVRRGFLDWLPRLADGGIVSADDLVSFAQGVEGQPYVWGGVNWGDCSGAVSALANFATGRSPFASRFATMTMDSELAARGFLPGLGPAGSLNVGWFNGGPYGGHTAATLPNGVNFEMGGQRGDGQYGGIAAGADDPMFTDHAHLPPEFFLGGDLGSPTFGGSLESGVTFGSGGGGSTSSGGGSSFSGGTSSFGGSSSWSGNVQQGDAIPVFVVNQGSSSSTNSSSAPGGDGVDASYQSAPATVAGPPGGAGVDSTYTEGGDKWAEWSKNASDRFAGAGSAFLEGQLEGMPFGNHLRAMRDRGSQINVIVQDMFEAVEKIRQEDRRKTMASGSRF